MDAAKAKVNPGGAAVDSAVQLTQPHDPVMRAELTGAGLKRDAEKLKHDAEKLAKKAMPSKKTSKKMLEQAAAGAVAGGVSGAAAGGPVGAAVGAAGGAAGGATAVYAMDKAKGR